MSEFPLPKGYQRMGPFPLDSTSVFTSLALLQDYATNNGSAYAGQICTVDDGSLVTVYKINSDKSVVPLDVTAADFGTF